MRVSKAHPIAGWLRVEARTYSDTLDHILRDRDQHLLADPQHSGLPPASREWFWSEQLPRLVGDPKVHAQVLERQAALAASRIAINDQIRRQAGALVEQQAEIDAELAMLEQVLQ
jgi:hypothetical protein